MAYKNLLMKRREHVLYELKAVMIDLHAEQWNKLILANFSSAEISLVTFFISGRK